MEGRVGWRAWSGGRQGGEAGRVVGGGRSSGSAKNIRLNGEKVKSNI